VMAYGSPSSLQDVERYLTRIRDGRRPTDEEVERLRARYMAIGGRSPLPEITQAQAQALEVELRNRGYDVKAHVGMLHSEPFIEDVVARVLAEGVRHIVALPLTPFTSRLSTGRYEGRVMEAMGVSSPPPRLTLLRGWNRHPGFIEAWVERVRARLDAPGSPRPMVVFTAHSLPSRVLEWGDPYPRQVRETCELVAGALGLGAWSLAYQSVGMGGGEWLGPEILEELGRLMGEGHRDFLIAPVGFVSDHLEVLYDIDVECRRFAEARGARLSRVESLNDSPTFIRALASIVEEGLKAHVPG
jgi:ferrochelatase